MPPSGQVWETVWRELENEGWLCVKHGERQRNHYLLPLGEQCNASVRTGSYVKSITAGDGSTRAVYRTRSEVEKHVQLTRGPLSTILASPNLPNVPPARFVLAPKKRSLPEPTSEPASTTTTKSLAPASDPTSTTATRFGRRVKKACPLEAPGANGEAQLMIVHQRSSDSPRTTVQMRAESVAQPRTKTAKIQRTNSGNRALRWSLGHAAISSDT